MHAQQYGMPCPSEYYPNSSSSSSSNASMNNPYLQPHDGHVPNFTNSFSMGSTFTYPHQEHRYLLDRGQEDLRLCPSSLVNNGLNATGLGFAGDPSASSSAFDPQPEEIAAYQYQQPAWGWLDPNPPAVSDHEIAAPAPIYPTGSAETPFFAGKSSSVAQAQTHGNLHTNGTPDTQPPQVHLHANQEQPLAHVLVPMQAAGATQLPTPAAMAVLLSPEGRSVREPAQTGYGIIPPSSASRSSVAALGHHLSGSSSNITVDSDSATNATRRVATRTTRAVEPHPVVATQQGVPMIPDSITREKKHACTMCHKRFDRPSTLRKHLLVHTGEKAFVCDTCGRRFGVASNLNRHVKRCILKPVNTPSPSIKPAHDAAEATALISSVTGPSLYMSSANKMSAKRVRGPTSTNSPSSSSTSGDFNSTTSSAMSSPSSSSRSSAESSVGQRLLGQKRRRRAPSPSQWVPHTLQNFNLHSEDFYSICAPLLPVVYDPPREERNAFGENISPTPYHPDGWNGVLPGPGSPHCGLGGKDVRNYGYGGGRGEYMVGRIQLVC